MAELDRHGMLVSQTPHEQYRHDFLVDLKGYIVNELGAVLDEVYERRVRPQLEDRTAPPADRHAVAELMEREPETGMWSALARAQHELYVDSTSACVYRQLPELVEKYRTFAAGGTLGSLTLDPDLEIPWYQSEVDTHSIPGGYLAELTADDVYAGARYDVGLNLFSRGRRGSLNDLAGRHGVALISKLHPRFEPKTIVDLGCGIGNATTPYVDAWPAAVVTGIDTAAPLLRYAHARAGSLGRRVHFRQENAERTSFADGSVDLVTCHILLHETSLAATHTLLREAMRILAPGGLFLSIDVPRHLTARTPYEQYRAEWDTLHNNEPFFGALLFDVDLKECAISAGFAPDSLHEEITRGESGDDIYGYWGFVAQKPGTP